MKKVLIVVLALIANSYALSPFTYNWTIRLTGDTATVTKWRANNDSVLNWASKVSDTLNLGVPRWKGFSNHDSTFRWMNIDTIPSADTVFTSKLKASAANIIKINAKANFDTLVGDSVKARTVTTNNVNFPNMSNFVARSGSFTMTLTGVSPSVTKTAHYLLIDSTVILSIPNITGTSNTTACTITGLPSEIQPYNHWQYAYMILDNDGFITNTPQYCTIQFGTITLQINGSATGFASANLKGAEQQTLIYSLREQQF